MERKESSPANGCVSNWTHENLRAQSNVDKGRYFIVCLVLIVLLFVSTVLLAFVPSITMCALAKYESATGKTVVYDEQP